MDRTILQLAKEAGATDAAGHSIDSGTVCFTHQEFEDFLQRFIEHQLEEVGEVKDDCNGYPWKRLGYTRESLLARQPLGTKCYVLRKPDPL